MYIEIGYSKDAVVTQGMIDEQLRLTLENLLKLGIIDEETKLEAHSTILMDPAYVHINSETDAQITELKKIWQMKIFTRSEDMVHGLIVPWKTL